MTTSHLALRGLLVLLAGLPLASLAGEPLIVVEDRGGASALPYYEALNLQPRTNAPARPEHWRAAEGSEPRSTAAPTCRHGLRRRSGALRRARPVAEPPAARAGPSV